MGRYFDEYMEEVGAYESEQPDTEWVVLNPYCKRGDIITINNKGYIAKVTENGLKYKRLHKGDKHGHQNVRYVDNDGVYREEYIHRLVAKYFVPGSCDEYPNVLHYDDDPYNNRASNLRWGNQKMNHLDSVRNGGYYAITDEDRERSYEITRRPIYAITPIGERLYFRSISDCCRALNVCSSNVNKVLRGEREHTRGYYFERADENE